MIIYSGYSSYLFIDDQYRMHYPITIQLSTIPLPHLLPLKLKCLSKKKRIITLIL